jgi:tRNA(fMet)-specific endonuclease VapC
VVRKVCLDSDVIIDFLREGNSKAIVSSLDAVFYTSSVNVFEVWYGKKSKENVPEFLDKLETFSFDEKAAVLAAEILLSLRKKGELVEYRDVFLAAICIRNELELLTLNLKHFERLKKFGLKLVRF